jgi:RHS repeat-associated protein
VSYPRPRRLLPVDPADSSQSIATVENDLPGGNSASGSTNAWGVTGYTHAGGIDRPLGVLRMNGQYLLASLYPQTNWRGQYDLATLDNGTQLPNPVGWPGKLAGAYLGASAPPAPYEWFGSLVVEQADASGLMYRRNRYYDPKSGRFTQPDPIGIAGGLNAYGFAGGDPVNFADPSGLETDPVTVAVFVTKAAVEVGPAVAGVVAATGVTIAQATMATVRAVGVAGETAAGIYKNTERIVSATKTAAYRVPDQLTKTTLTEVKNVARLGLSNQIKDFQMYAREKGLDMELRVRDESTKLSLPLRNYMEQHNIALKYISPVNQ